MANYRQIHVSIWKDEWFIDLNSDEKLLFIYLFSNELASLSGIYKLPIKVMHWETGLDEDFIKNSLIKFEQGNKVIYREGIVWIVNMRKYHKGSSLVEKRIQKDLDEIPDCELKHIYIAYYQKKIPYSTNNIPYPYGIDTISLIKEEENKEEEERKGSSNSSSVFNSYESEIGVLTPKVMDSIASWIDDEQIPEEWIIAAIEEASRQNKRSWSYAEAILKRWQVEGFQSNRKDSKTNGTSVEELKRAGYSN